MGPQHRINEKVLRHVKSPQFSRKILSPPRVTQTFHTFPVFLFNDVPCGTLPKMLWVWNTKNSIIFFFYVGCLNKFHVTTSSAFIVVETTTHNRSHSIIFYMPLASKPPKLKAMVGSCYKHWFFFFFDGKPQITLSLLRIKNPHRIHPTGLGQQLQEGCLPPISDTPKNI